MTIYTSPYPPLPPPTKVGVFDFLFTDNPNIDPEAVAIVDVGTSTSLTYRSLITQSLQFADGLLRNAGLNTGDTVLVFSPNSLPFAITVFACQAAGLACSTANPSYTPNELAHQLKVSGAKVVVAGGDVVATVQEGCRLAGVAAEGIFVLPGMGGEVNVPEGLRSWEELRGEDGFVPVKVHEPEKTIAYLPFSSGTTGVAKGVAITHQNMTAAIQTGVTNPLYAKEYVKVMMGTIPFYHAFGLTWILHQVLYLGHKIVMLPRFDMETFLGAIEEHQVTLAPVVPPIALGLLRHPIVAKYDLSSLRVVCSGAAPLGFALQQQLQARLAAQPRRALKTSTLVLQGWGMSETTGTGFIADISAGDAKRLTIGKLMGGMEARLVDEQDRDVGEGEQGELGYFGNPKATAETFLEGGWMRTGDVAVRAADGDYTIVDRRKELIKYKGFQVPPAELEATLLGCPLVADAAVIGVYDDEKATELPRAYIVPDSAHAADADLPAKVAAFVAAQVAPHKKLRGGVHLVDVVPKSPSGKILRKDLRTLAAKEGIAAKGKL